MTYERDPVLASLASRARDQVKAGIRELHAGNPLAAEVFFNAACATLQSLVVHLDGAPPPPLRKLAIVGPARDADIQPWMTKKHGGDDGNAA